MSAGRLALAMLVVTLMASGCGQSGPMPNPGSPGADGHPTLPYRAVAVTTTQCIGSCAAYSATFRSDGSVTYRGERYVDRLGEHVGRLDFIEYAALCEFIGRIHFAGLSNAYRAPGADQQTVTIAVTDNGGETKTVLDYGSRAPAEFWALHRVLEGLLTRVRWAETQTR